jgi:hypothetical protein
MCHEISTDDTQRRERFSIVDCGRRNAILLDDADADEFGKSFKNAGGQPGFACRLGVGPGLDRGEQIHVVQISAQQRRRLSRGAVGNYGGHIVDIGDLVVTEFPRYEPSDSSDGNRQQREYRQQELDPDRKSDSEIPSGG